MARKAPVTGAGSDAHDLWDACFAQLAGYCAAILADREQGSDVAAEAFARLWARWSRVEQPRAYLYVIATNLCRDHWKRATSERTAVAELGRGLSDAQPVDPWLRDLVERLPDKLRQPVLLHYYADLPVSDVASALRRPEGTVKSQLADARHLLGIQIEESSR